jgi:pilus assembly protein Flp/PilA
MLPASVSHQHSAGLILETCFLSQPGDEVLQMKKFIVAFLKDEEGLTMVEYAIAGALVSIAAVTAFTNLGTAVAGRIGALVTAVTT